MMMKSWVKSRENCWERYKKSGRFLSLQIGVKCFLWISWRRIFCLSNCFDQIFVFMFVNYLNIILFSISTSAIFEKMEILNFLSFLFGSISRLEKTWNLKFIDKIKLFTRARNYSLSKVDFFLKNIIFLSLFFKAKWWYFSSLFESHQDGYKSSLFLDLKEKYI